MSWNRKWRSKTVKDVLEQEIKEKEIVIVQSHVSFCILTDCPDPSHPRACPVVPLCRDNEGSSVPLSWKVALSLPLETLVSLQSSYSSFSLYLPNFILKFLTLQAAMDDNSRAEKQAWGNSWGSWGNVPTYCKVASSNISCLEAHAGFFQIVYKEDFWSLCTFDKKLIS